MCLTLHGARLLASCGRLQVMRMPADLVAELQSLQQKKIANTVTAEEALVGVIFGRERLQRAYVGDSQADLRQ